MKWDYERWTIEKLLDLYDTGKINLTPDYQRNPIWTSKSQKCLIDTILSPQPIPNFFLLRKPENIYEMVDGQQRSRSIIDFRNGIFSSSSKEKFDKSNSAFLKYELNMTIITYLDSGESIEEYYALVNSSGLRLNVPELRKAKYYDTKFLALCSEMAALDQFTQFNLFGNSTVERMNDVELVSELLTLILVGHSEKKEAVDRLFEDDITDEKVEEARGNFKFIVDILAKMNELSPLCKTRYKQRADLYTLVDFIWVNRKLTPQAFQYYYKILLAIAPHIRPTQEHCSPLRDYARNCVSQSNSKIARIERSAFFDSLMRSPKNTPNATQEAITVFLNFVSGLVEIEGAWTINIADNKEGQ